MIFLKKIILILSIFPLALCQENLDPDVFPRPLIIEINETHLQEWPVEEVQSQCTSWRVAGEANNLNPWKTIPEECADYVKEYMTGKGYALDLQRVSNEAALYARSVDLSGDGKIAWVFDVDETLLSNLPYYAEHGYGMEIFDSMKFDEWVEMGIAPAIDSSLKLYEEVLSLGFKVILLTGRSERHRNITVENLVQAGFHEWDKLIVRSLEDQGKTATRYKSEKRNEITEDGYQILGNSGDQWSDLLGSSMSIRSFKLPNPMYYIP
ncbi:Acid phosphatase [Handroanthus impetiginosus]|uniref:Acid phosphatase n=1 Tax=Handroanthus impetiginosus TaxID=429701 RepID=A0A2G9GC83_9LAMI|nr:Acid phosphatase [Handroanthus impetiginosus]